MENTILALAIGVIIGFSIGYILAICNRKRDYSECAGCPIATQKQFYKEVDYSKFDLDKMRRKAKKIMEKYK